LKGARYIYETLATNHVLEDLEIQYPNYHIAICGHSLGAGIGSLLALLLKYNSLIIPILFLKLNYRLKYSDVRCFAFAPPGSVISENGIADTEKSTLTILVGDDMIPRMTYQAMHYHIEFGTTFNLHILVHSLTQNRD
jgi:sn1-specific diacylglycerol lipase